MSIPNKLIILSANSDQLLMYAWMLFEGYEAHFRFNSIECCDHSIMSAKEKDRKCSVCLPICCYNNPEAKWSPFTPLNVDIGLKALSLPY